MVLAGAVSKRVYEMYAAHIVVDIDVRDEPALRATGWFESMG
jgi:phosphoribosylformimino-5-aminoimidazole carboxamide ribonucleotide (ProFAR) isomerase